MNKAVPTIAPVHTTIPLVLGESGDPSELLCAYGLSPEEMVSILVQGDWISTCEGPVEMTGLFKDLAAQVPEDKTLCAIVITGHLAAPGAVLIDRDSDWAPSLIVGGNLTARSICLGGGQTKVMGNLSVQNALYGHYNHGTLEVHGTTTAEVILSDDFSMEFYGAVNCRNVLSASGSLNIEAHYENEALAGILKADLLDSNNNPIEELVLDTLAKNQSLLLSPAEAGKKPRHAVSKAGRELLAALEATAQRRPVFKLNFEGCDLKFVPEAIANFTDAKWLSLAGNRIGSLPDCLAKLENLEVLHISDCGLSSLPDWLGHMPKLRTLDARQNDVVGLPAFEGAFSALEELQIGNPFSDSNAHKQWICLLPLARFPNLRSFTNHLNVTGTFTSSSDFDAWFNPALEHLKMTPEVAGALPACLASMPRLKSLDLQIKADIQASALGVLSQLKQLEAIQFHASEVNKHFLLSLAAALPDTLIRCEGLRKQEGMASAASLTKVWPDISGLLYQNQLDEALSGVDQKIADAERLSHGLALEEDESPLQQKLDVLCHIARNTADWPVKRRCIEAAALWATAVLERYRRLSVSTMWRLGFRLGSLRTSCLTTQAWWLIRSEHPDHAGAAKKLDQAQAELLAYGTHTHVTAPLQREIDALRELMAA